MRPSSVHFGVHELTRVKRLVNGRGTCGGEHEKIEFASTVCVFSFEQSAYSKEIAVERKDTHSTQLTPEELCSVILCGKHSI